jgi:hypothetical protein
MKCHSKWEEDVNKYCEKKMLISIAKRKCFKISIAHYSSNVCKSVYEHFIGGRPFVLSLRVCHMMYCWVDFQKLSALGWHQKLKYNF